MVASVNSTSMLSRAALWIHEHPKTVKTLEVGSTIAGLSALALAPFHAQNLGIKGTVGFITAGALLTLAGTASLLALDTFIPPHHEMTQHAYTPAECRGGRLYYEGDIPILSLQADDPFEAGFAHGYLCGDAINQITKRQSFVSDTLLQQEPHWGFSTTLDLIREKIPEAYLREMKGLVEGYNQWASEKSWWKSPKQLTLEELILINAKPDAFNLGLTAIPAHRMRYVMPFLNVLSTACSSIVDEENGLVIARNLDWHSHGLLGTFSLIIHRQYTNGQNSIVEVGIPSLVGTLTGMNDQGLCLAMNTLAEGGVIQTIWGMPAMLYNRMCLEQCHTASDVEDFVRAQTPLVRCHLTVADPTHAVAVSFSWGRGQERFVVLDTKRFAHQLRRKEEHTPLITLNDTYSATPDIEWPMCTERQHQLQRFFQNRAGRAVEETLALPHVNNYRTIHRVVMQPKLGLLQVAFDNAFAGKVDMHTLSVGKLFLYTATASKM